MPKRKKSVSKDSIIPGLTSGIIHNLAACNSYERGADILSDGDVMIDSHSNNSIEASINGKSYSISISYTEYITSSLDVECDCSCPDDRDGCCKHTCAVLLKFIDPSPNPKKRKLNKSNSDCNSNNNNNNKENKTITQLKQSLNNLDKSKLINIINESLQYKCVQKIVSKTLNVVKNEHIDISGYKSRIYEAIHQLDRLRPSAQFSMSYKVGSDLGSIISDAEKHFNNGNNIGAMQILIAIGNSICKENSIEGEVWKSIHGCGGIDFDIADLMLRIVKNDNNIKKNKNIYNSIASMNSTLSEYCIEDYDSVIECFEI